MSTVPAAPTDPLDYAKYTPYLSALGLTQAQLVGRFNTSTNLLTGTHNFLRILQYSSVSASAIAAAKEINKIKTFVKQGLPEDGGSTLDGYANNFWTSLLSATDSTFDKSIILDLSATQGGFDTLTAINLSALNGFINNLSSFNVSASQGVFDNLTATNLSAFNGFIDNLSSFNVSATQGVFDTLTATNLSAQDGFIDNLSSFNVSATQGVFDTLTATNLSAFNGFINNLSSFNVSATQGVFDTLTATNLSAHSGFINNLSSFSISATQGEFKNLTATNLSAFNGFINNLTAINLSAKDVKVETLTSKSISATQGVFNALTATNLSAHNGFIDNLSSFNISATQGVFDNLTATNLNTVNITSDYITVNHDLTANTIYTDFLHVRFPDGGGDDGSFNGEFLELINVNFTDVPALRVTQFGQNPIAVFNDQSGDPDFNITNIIAGGSLSKTFALATDVANTVYIWGDSAHGELLSLVSNFSKVNKTTNKFSQIAAGEKHTVVFDPSLKQVSVVGNNALFQLSTTVVPGAARWSVPIHIGTEFKAIGAGSYHSFAIKENGDMFSWGSNTSGQLGNGVVATADSVDDNKLTQVIGTAYTAAAGGAEHSIALKENGSVVGWGANSKGQLGTGNLSVPTGTPRVVLGIETGPWVKISCGLNHSAAINAAGELFLWGANESGQCGDGSTTDVMVPVKISGTYKHVSCGRSHTAAITTDGDLKTWGSNTFGQIGNNSTSNTSTPVHITPNIKYNTCTAGVNCTYAIAENGNLFAWGNNQQNQLGKSGVTESLVPLLIIDTQTSTTGVAMLISGSDAAPGFVGIKTSTPNKELTVRGSISASGTILGDISSNNAVIQNLTATQLSSLSSTIINLTATKSTLDTVHANILTAAALTATDGIFTTLSANDISAVNFFITNGKFDNLTATNLTVDHLTSKDGVFETLSSTDLKTTNLTSFDLNVTHLATISSLSAHDITADIINVTAANVLNDLTVGHDIRVTNDVFARVFHGEFIGEKTVTGDSADYVRLSAQKATIDSLSAGSLTAIDGYFKNLTADNFTSTNSTITSLRVNSLTANALSATNLSGLNLSVANFASISSLSASLGIIDNLTARNLSAIKLTAVDFYVKNLSAETARLTSTYIEDLTGNIGKFAELTANFLVLSSNDHTCLTVHQSSVNGLDVAKFYYGDSHLPGDNIALIIKGKGDPTDFAGGFVGIRTEDPTVALEVNGDIIADNITGKTSISSRAIMGGSGSFTEDVIIDAHLTVNQNLTVLGNIHGNLLGTFTSTGKTILESISTSSLTADDIVVRNLTAHKIVMSDGSGGGSDLWNLGYHVPIVINLMLNGGEDNIKIGAKGCVQVPYDVALESWSMYADVPSATEAIMYVLSSSHSTYPTTGKMCTVDPFIPASEVKNTSVSMSDWPSVIPAGTVLHFGVSGATVPGGLAEPEASLLTLCLSGHRR